jgi:hypothetical protein
MGVIKYSFEGLKNRIPRLYYRQEILDIYVSSSSSSSSWHSKDVIKCVISFIITAGLFGKTNNMNRKITNSWGVLWDMLQCSEV